VPTTTALHIEIIIAAQAEKKKPKKKQQPQTDGVGSKIAKFFSGLLDAKKNGTDSMIRGALRGTINAANETAKTLNTAAVATGAMDKKDNTTADPTSFIETFSKPIAEDEIDDRLGKKPEGAAGFVENATQFAVGMVGVNKFLKPLKVAETGATALKFAAKGGAVDMTAFDPYQKRISNMIQDGPSWLANPVTEFLSAKETDAPAVARLKAGLEGMLTGYTIDKLAAGLKVAKGALSASTPEAQQAVIAEAKKLPEIAHSVEENGPVVVKPEENGTFSVTEQNTTERRVAARRISGPGRRKTDPAVYGLGANAARKADAGEIEFYQKRDIPFDEFKELHPHITTTKAEWDAVADDIAKRPAPLTFPNEADAESVAASMNQALTNARQPRGELTAEQVAAVKKSADEYTPKVLFGQAQPIQGTDFNFNYSVAPDEAKKVINAISEVLPEPTTGLTNRSANGLGQSHAETVKLAEGLLADMSGEQIVDAISSAFDNTEKLPQLITATRTYLYGLGKKVAQLSRVADVNPDNPVAFNELKNAMENLWETHASLAGTSSNVGRALDAHKIKVGVDAAETAAASAAPVKLATPLAGMTKQELRALARQIVMTEGDPTEIMSAMRASKAAQGVKKDPTMMERINNFRVEAMLSGPKTQLVNAVNNALVAFQMPTEYWWAGVRSGNKALREQGSDQLAGLFLEARDAWRAAGKAFRTGSNALDEAGSLVADAGAVKTGSSMVRGVSTLAHLPSRMLLTTDEFFKTLSYRSSVRAQSLRLAREQGVTDPAQVAQRVADDLKAAFTLEGRATHPVALQYARTATFQNPLEYGIGKWIQQGVQEHPSLRLVMPFVRTPVNLFRYAWQRTPGLNRFTREWQADIAAGGDRAAVAQAKTEMGMMAYTTAASLALSGNITGAGPSNPELRKQWLAAGHQPYSVKIPGGGWVSFRRGDPSMIPLGLVADLVAISGELHSDDITEHAAAIAAAIASNISSKTFMQGVTETMDAISSGDGFRMTKLLTNTATSFIPNFLRQSEPRRHTARDAWYAR
jgi:hypothetical protein